MTEKENQAILTISLLAAYADSGKHARESDAIRRIASELAQSALIDLSELEQDLEQQRSSLASAAAALQSEESRQLAYETAVSVCDADGSTSEKELAFLSELRQALDLGEDFASATLDDAEALNLPPPQELAGAAITADASDSTAGEKDAGEAWLDSSEPAPHPELPQLADAAGDKRSSTLSPAELDSKILRAATINGAIELLPESLSTMAIIPLQVRLVYQIGQSYGYELDQGHIRDFLATIGVGLTSQYLEQAGRKLLGGLLGRIGGGLLGGVGKQAVSSGMSFAATYALGHVATQYYAGGRKLSPQLLKDAFAQVQKDGRELQAQYAPKMQAMTEKLNRGTIMDMVRGKTTPF